MFGVSARRDKPGPGPQRERGQSSNFLSSLAMLRNALTGRPRPEVITSPVPAPSSLVPAHQPVASGAPRALPAGLRPRARRPADTVHAEADDDVATEMTGRGKMGRARLREQQRISAILSSEEAAMLPAAAQYIALETRMSRQDALAMLARHALLSNLRNPALSPAPSHHPFFDRK